MAASLTTPTSVGGDRVTALFNPTRHPEGNVTYGDLRAHHLNNLEAELHKEGKSLNWVNNHNTALNKWLAMAIWMRASGSDRSPQPEATDQDLVGPEFGVDFDSWLNKHLVEMERLGLAKSTVDNRKSLLCKWQASWRQLLGASLLPESFADALKELLAQNNRAYAEVARATGASPNTIRAWASGIHLPSLRNLPMVDKLEEYFGLQPGTLTSRLPGNLAGAREAHERSSQQTPYRSYLAKMQGKPYRLRQEQFTLEQRRGWELLAKFHTDLKWAAAQGLTPPATPWRVRENNKKNSTARVRAALVENFFGWLLLPQESDDPGLAGKEFDPKNKDHEGVRGFDPHLQGRGLNPDEVSLVLLTDPALVYEHLEFLRGRAFENRHNNTARNYLHFCRQLVRPKTGFLWQFDEFGRHLSPPILSKDEWRSRCAEVHERVKNIVSSIESNANKNDRFVITRDTTLAVVVPLIRSREHPITALTDVVAGLRRSFEATRNLDKKALLFRDMILFEILSSNPMRAINISEMKYKLGGTGLETDETNLYRRGTLWRLKYEEDELKNGRARGRYDLPVHPAYHSDLDEYFNVWRPRFPDADVCDYVFLASSQWRKRNPVTSSDGVIPPMTIASFSGTVRRWSKLILGCAGFGIHSARHFVATEWVKFHPGAYKVPAIVLHDSERMIEDTYSWIEPDDVIPFWNDHLGGVLGQQGR